MNILFNDKLTFLLAGTGPWPCQEDEDDPGTNRTRAERSRSSYTEGSTFALHHQISYRKSLWSAIFIDLLRLFIFMESCILIPADPFSGVVEFSLDSHWFAWFPLHVGSNQASAEGLHTACTISACESYETWGGTTTACSRTGTIWTFREIIEGIPSSTQPFQVSSDSVHLL